MGQQQQLLLIGTIIIVGIAIVLGINVYSESSSKTNADALLQDAVRIANDAQSWKLKPEMFAGSPDDTKHERADYSGVTFYHFGYTSSGITEDGECYENQNGQYALFAEDDFLGILGTNPSTQNMVGVVVTGTTAETVKLYEANWNPVIGGTGADGRKLEIRRHKRCLGPGNTPMHAGTQ